MVSEKESSVSYQACHCCGLIHRLPSLSVGEYAACNRCGISISDGTNAMTAASRTAAASIGAFVLFWPAVLLPILQIEKFGHVNQQSIVSGIAELFHHGNFFIGSVVLLFSIVFPLVKIVLLIELSCLQILHRRHKAVTLRLMEHLGKWSMMDVMLLAFLVMLVKLGNLVHFEFGSAVIAFVLCVVMSMIASLLFDARGIWGTTDQ